MKRKTILLLLFFFPLFFVVSSYAQSTGHVQVLAKTPYIAPGVSASFVIVVLSIALAALVFALKRGKDKYEEE